MLKANFLGFWHIPLYSVVKFDVVGYSIRGLISLFAEPVTITVHPRPATVRVDQPVSLSCSATGTAPITFTWYVDSSSTPLDVEQSITTSGETITSTITLSGRAEDEGMYYCTASNTLTTAGVFTETSDMAQVIIVCKDILRVCVEFSEHAMQWLM